MQSKKLKFLGMPRFVGSGSHDYRGEKYRFMVMQRFGTDIQKLFDAAKRRFPVNTVINLGLRMIVCPDIEAAEGDELELSADALVNKTSGRQFKIEPMPRSRQVIIDAGGLIAYTRKRLQQAVA